MTKHDADSQALAVAEKAGALASQASAENPIAATLQTIVEKGVTTDNVAALEKVCDLYERMEALGAKKAFASAKAALQAELPAVQATRIIPTKTGETRSVFAAYEDIMEAVGPQLVKHGFSVSFTMRAENSRMTAVLTLMHIGGHSESNEFSVRVGQGPPGCSEAQADGAARSYARRGALCDCLNISIDHDSDARLEGGIITPDQAKALRDRVRALKENEAAFLKLAGADTFEAIHESKLPVLERALAGKQKAATASLAPLSPLVAEVRAMCWVLCGKKPGAVAKGLKRAADLADLPLVMLTTYAPEDLARIAAVLRQACKDKSIDWTPHLPGGPEPVPDGEA